MEIRKCLETDIPETGRFYDRAVEWLDSHINYPKWEYGVYPSETSARNQTHDGGQYICLDRGKIVGAFVLNADPEGSYWKGKWENELADGSYLVIHALAVDRRNREKGSLRRSFGTVSTGRESGVIRRCGLTSFLTIIRPELCMKNTDSDTREMRIWTEA